MLNLPSFGLDFFLVSIGVVSAMVSVSSAFRLGIVLQRANQSAGVEVNRKFMNESDAKNRSGKGR